MLPLVLISCGGGGGGGGGGGSEPPPGNIAPPSGLVINAGDGAASAGWLPPATDSPAGYSVTLTPDPGTNPVIDGTHAYVRGLVNNTQYTVSVSSDSSSDDSEVIATFTPSAIADTDYRQLVVEADPSISGVFDPAFLNGGDGTVWMAYSGVDYYISNGDLVKDVSSRLGRSDNSGLTFSLVTTLGPAQNATVEDPSGTLGCDNDQCEGRWVYEVPLIDDASDPDPSRRYKYFAHKYFLYPPAGGARSERLEQGSIVMWTAPSLDNNSWSQEESVITWLLTPPELGGGTSLGQIDPALADCIILTEGGVATSGQNLEFVFSCAYEETGPDDIVQRIVQLRSTDHARSFSYVGTLLDPSDAGPLGADFFSAPALLPTLDSAPVLLVSRVKDELYSGCDIYPYGDFDSARLMRQNGNLLPLLEIGKINDKFTGACSWDRGLTEPGIGVSVLGNEQFNIFLSGKSL